MKFNSINIKLAIGTLYLILLAAGLIYLITNYNISDFFNYEFIRTNKDVILDYKKENFLLFALLFFIFCIIWTLALGFAGPLLIFAGFVFGKWWGVILVLASTTIGATLLYMLANLFFRDIIEKKLAPKFSKLKFFFNKNELIYFMSYRFIGGGGTPYGIQNVLPVIFNMKIKNYVIATLFGSAPSMFVTTSLGSGIENVIDKNATFSFFTALKSPEIYLPVGGFVIILLFAILIKKIYFKN